MGIPGLYLPYKGGRHENKIVKFAVVYCWNSFATDCGIPAVFYYHCVHIGSGNGLKWRSMVISQETEPDRL